MAKKKTNRWDEEVAKTIKKLGREKDFQMVFVGDIGRGRTLRALRWFEIMGMKPDHTIYTEDEFLKLVKEKELKKGQTVFWDYKPTHLEKIPEQITEEYKKKKHKKQEGSVDGEVLPLGNPCRGVMRI